jgi:hypothetical protein
VFHNGFATMQHAGFLLRFWCYELAPSSKRVPLTFSIALSDQAETIPTDIWRWAIDGLMVAQSFSEKPLTVKKTASFEQVLELGWGTGLAGNGLRGVARRVFGGW